MKKTLKKIKKLFKFRPHKTYTPIATLILSNRNEIESLRIQTGDERYDLVPIYDNLRFELYPMEFAESRLRRKRKLIKKAVGKHKFKILQGFWTFGVNFFNMEEYQNLLKERELKKQTENQTPSP